MLLWFLFGKKKMAHFPHFTGVHLLEEISEHIICLYYLKAQQSVAGNMVDL